LRSLEPAARALLADASAGTPLERAQGAVRLAPDWPAAHGALALAHLSEAEPGGAWKAFWEGLRATGRHLEASLWLRATLFHKAQLALAVGALLFLALCALVAAPRLVHDLGHLGVLPSHVARAWLACLVLAPVALGEGALGLGLGLLGLSAACARGTGRVAVGLAGAALWLGLHPAAESAGRALAALDADPLLEAAHATSVGLPSPLEAARLERAQGHDPVAGQALALRAKRAGDLEEASQRYAALLERAPDDPVLANNAANVALARGEVDRAISLYGRAAEALDSPLVLFNLARAYGAAIRLEEHSATLARAQELDASEVLALLDLAGASSADFVLDLPTPPAQVIDRLAELGGGPQVAHGLREGLAPGWLGRSPLGAAIALAVVGLLGGLAGWLASRSERCGGCRRLLCARCGPGSLRTRRCADCTALRRQVPRRRLEAEAEAGVGAHRSRLASVARTQRAALLVPGAAALLAQRPLLGLLGALLAACAGACLLLPPPAPDPLAAGAIGSLLVLGLGLGLGVVYAGALVAARPGRSGP
jgi:tetratricopeptide (TPR) repeat protein